MVTPEVTREATPEVARDVTPQPGATSGQTGPARAHVTCLDCGREFWYDWKRMRRLSARQLPVYRSYRSEVEPRRIA